MARIIIATHGALSKGLLDSMRMVSGDVADGVETFSLELGANPNDYYEELRPRIEADAGEQYVILCDIKGGSVHTALMRLLDLPNVALFSGVTLGMALEVALTCRDGLTPVDAARIVDEAREGVTALMGGSEPDAGEDEDF